MEYISRIEKGEYELVVRCDDYKQFKAFESLIRDKMAKNSNKEFVTDQLASELKHALLKGLIEGLSQSAGESDSCKGKCVADEKILTPNKQEEKMQKAREAFAELKKSVKNLTNGETK